MKLFVYGLRLLFDLFVKRLSRGAALRRFTSSMGLAYIKFAQILAMNNIDNIFTETDRRDIMSICDDCNPLPYSEIHKILLNTYGRGYIKQNFKKILRKPVGSASISQVHRVILTTGEQVVLKIRRNDIAKSVEHDISTIRTLCHRLGWIFGLHNRIASDAAFKYFDKWIHQEIDFENEMRNIKRYTEFARSVNGKVPGCVDIVLPKLYEQHCRENIICMEYIPNKTIFHMDVTDEHIVNAFNSYIQLSFYALFNDMPVVWHGDPHGGNVYVDDDGNIGFLDMGLLFEMSPENAELTRRLFMCAYLGLYDQLYDMLKPYLGEGVYGPAFREELKHYCQTRQGKPISTFFMDVVWICFDFEIHPPEFLFEMAKAFVCLNGADNIFDNRVAGFDLLEKQVDDWLLNESKRRVVEHVNEFIDVLKGDTPKMANFLRKYYQFSNKLKEQLKHSQ